MIKRLIVLFYVFLSLPSVLLAAQGVTLESYMTRVLESSEELQALELDIQSLQMEIAARDLEFSPVLNLDLLRFWDNRPSSTSNRQTEGKSAEVTLTKPFASGTDLTLSSYLEQSEHLLATDEQNLLNWQVGISQSLWQNSFGRQKTLRRQRDQFELQSRLLTLLLKQQELLVEFESLYWDIAYSQQEVKIRTENLERSRRMLTWIQERFGRAAAEHIDMLQGQTLVASRELQLQLATETLRSSMSLLREKLILESDIEPNDEDIRQERELKSLLVRAEFAHQTPVMIETLKSKAEADYLTAVYEFESDQLKPELEVGYSYGQQGYHTSFSTARDQAFSRKKDYHQIGVVFSIPLDMFLIRKSRMAKQTAAQAQLKRAGKFARQSEVVWEDIEKTISEQKQRVETARNLARLQAEKIQEERGRYERGRSTVFQAISFEQEAAESELLVMQLLNQLRKTESRARLYVQKEETKL